MLNTEFHDFKNCFRLVMLRVKYQKYNTKMSMDTHTCT